jgi:hypothetical protein
MVLLEQNDEWLVQQRRYLSELSMRQLRVPPGAPESGTDEEHKEVIELQAA